MTTSAHGAVQAYRHEAVFYRDVDDYVDSLVPFIAESLPEGEPVLVAVPTERLATLRAALRGTSGVTFVDRPRWGRTPPASSPPAGLHRRQPALRHPAPSRRPAHLGGSPAGGAGRVQPARGAAQRRRGPARPSATTRGCSRTGPCTPVWTTTRTSPDPAAVVCEIRDRGRILDPLVGRRMPSSTAESSRGLWMVHQLVDLAQIRSSGSGTTVRMHTWR